MEFGLDICWRCLMDFEIEVMDGWLGIGLQSSLERSRLGFAFKDTK